MSRGARAPGQAAARGGRADGDARRSRLPDRPTGERRARPERPPKARMPPAGARSTSCSWRRSTRAISCTTAHRGSSQAPDANLRLLAGDRLYAIGLALLVALGDTAAVAELADTITLSALAQAAGELALAEAVWAAGARAVGWGSSEAHRQRQGARPRGRARGDRGDAHKCRAAAGAALNRASILFARGVRQARTSTSPSTRLTGRFRVRSRARRSRADAS